MKKVLLAFLLLVSLSCKKETKQCIITCADGGNYATTNPGLLSEKETECGCDCEIECR